MKSAEKIEEEDVATQKEMKKSPKKLLQRERNLFLGKAQDIDKVMIGRHLSFGQRTQDVDELYRPSQGKVSASRLRKDLSMNTIDKAKINVNLCIHILLMENRLAIHMLTEKKYPLSQELLSKMLSKKLEVDHESSQAFELLKEKKLILLMVKAADLEISMHGDYYGMMVTDP
ncbi:hypothetical protein Tco_1105321 [Tanacetum coccineum]